jgi:hypothetical protein
MQEFAYQIKYLNTEQTYILEEIEIEILWLQFGIQTSRRDRYQSHSGAINSLIDSSIEGREWALTIVY